MNDIKYLQILKKAERIQALYERPGSDGEKAAAALALKRVREKLAQFHRYEFTNPRKPKFVLFHSV